ncbi:multiple sugar transport system permease protein [Aquibacillus albus]|uniref:Multiple sugar transport system permease protein n=1 Tax=Aquibacillus albus TaxID=1168171 RepID=A0ABS2MZF7_9BACI|nr:multiple sugar transport system permease protein [Aquibacillus albus]
MKLNIRKLLTTILMLAVGVAFILPFIWMISASLKPESEVFAYPIQWIPEELKWSNYKTAWSDGFPLYYWNSIKVTVITTLISATVSTMSAYGFSKIHFKSRDLIFILVLATFMIPAQAILVPQFLLFKYLNLFDTHVGLILLNSFSVLGTFMLRQFFMGIHDDYIASAKIDGAGHLRIFSQIAVPLVLPAISTYFILRFIWTWNDYQGPLIFIRSDHLYTIQVGIDKFSNESGELYSLIMAGAVSAILPLLIIFIIGQRYVLEGIALGGVKG